ncbi:hypothetical protein PHAVU_011G188000 [Phaseolus vulgaris]|uniref:Knottin scorpion toxin-like domain-containing protein n=1 Tax=Phaseolus vulgaris TaxID=3885 RepID=V7AKY4_PHAVU|nr:hypothetical protein PHAVU_011G188000g [Phaseolus vulgaris]ESW05538.1 hypothetical protein PHAVU_011G188000g [Phaseolus vulgaris]
MKLITSVLILLLVLAIDIENEGAMKVVEAGRCEEKLNEDCQESKCNSDCVRKHGNLASGRCNAIEDCICRFPC